MIRQRRLGVVRGERWVPRPRQLRPCYSSRSSLRGSTCEPFRLRRAVWLRPWFDPPPSTCASPPRPFRHIPPRYRAASPVALIHIFRVEGLDVVGERSHLGRLAGFGWVLPTAALRLVGSRRAWLNPRRSLRQKGSKGGGGRSSGSIRSVLLRDAGRCVIWEDARLERWLLFRSSMALTRATMADRFLVME